MEEQKEENNEEKENNNIKNNDNNSDNDLYLKQEKEIIDNYNERKNKIKSAFDSMYERFLQNHTFYESFIYLIKDYKESKLKNIDSLTNILNKYFTNNDNNINKSEYGQINTIKNEFKEIINIQIIAEKEKINEIYLDDKYKKIEDDLKRSRELMDDLYNLYNSYISSLNKIKEAHLIYIKLFYNYEKKLIDIANKSMTIKDLNNNEN